MIFDINEKFINNHSKDIASVSDIIVVPGLYDIINPKYSKQLYNNQVEEWVLYGRHSYYDLLGESWAELDLRLLKNLIDVHPELVGLLKISDDSGNMVDYVPEKLFKFNEEFIKKNIEEILWVEDYIPFDINNYDEPGLLEDGWTVKEMREFALDEYLIKTLKEMDKLILQKCLAYEDRIKAFNSVVIEWLNSYPDFEGIIAEESYAEYQSMKNSSNYIEFIDLLYDVEIPSERVSVDLQHDKNVIHKDDSNIKLPDFNKMRAISSKYDSPLLIEYLCYLV